MTATTLPAPLYKALKSATGFGWIRCSDRTARSLSEQGLATIEGEKVRITAAGREVQMDILRNL